MTLILSSSDFLIERNSVVSLGTGSARLHTDIGSAGKGYDSGSLPSSSYCREYNGDEPLEGGSSFNPIYVSVSSSVDGGSYVGPFGDNAISVRAWAMVEAGSFPTFTLYVKNPNNGSSQEGYYVEYNSQVLRMGARVGGTPSGETQILDSVTDDIWHRFRLDYIPVGTMKDIINFYTSSAGGTNEEVWEFVASQTILNTDAWYITASLSDTRVGYSLSSPGASDRIWIDDFDVYVTPVG